MQRLKVRVDRSWAERALCAGDEPDSLFVQGAAQREARNRCISCPVRVECLADALQHEANFGVWGGLTERERRALLRRYADVTNWYEWLETSEEGVAQELRRSQIPKVLALTKE